MKFLRRFCDRLSEKWRSSLIDRVSQLRGVIVGAVVLSFLPIGVSAEVVISEIMYDVTGSDGKTEWIEIQNTGTSAVDLSKWKFNDGSNHTLNAPPKNGSTGSLTLEPGAYLILASDAGTFLAAHSVSVSVIDTTMSLGNDKGSISLINASSTVEDKATYSTSKGAAGDGNSLQEIDGKWKASAPTPGVVNIYVQKPKVAAASIKKTSSKKVAVAPKPEILDAASTVSPEIATAESVASSSFAAAVVPVESGSLGYVPWAYGALATGVAGAGAIFVSRQKKKGEWEIEEIA